MNALDAAIFAKLTGDASLLALINGVYHRSAPANVVEPFLIFAEQSGVDSQVFGGRLATNRLYLVKMVDKSASAQRAGTAYERADAVLENQPLTISGHVEVHRLHREQTVEYDEPGPAGETYQHVGGRYRIVTSAS